MPPSRVRLVPPTTRCRRESARRPVEPGSSGRTRGHHSRKGRENIPVAGTNCGRGENIPVAGTNCGRGENIPVAGTNYGRGENIPW
eukprot:509031-Pyramimonas_sp.AAC.2